jgi:hypothetical protein
MRLSGRPGRIIFGLIVATGIAVTLPNLAFGAARSFGKAGSFRAPRIHREHFSSRHFHGVELFDGGGLGGQQVIVIQQVQSQPTTEPREPANNRIYVLPRWVDGGYGVQVLKPGYWIDPKHAAER